MECLSLFPLWMCCGLESRGRRRPARNSSLSSSLTTSALGESSAHETFAHKDRGFWKETEIPNVGIF